MAWTIILEDENRNPIQKLEKDYNTKLLNNDLIINRMILLKYLDPYGDAIFNHLQMEDLILDFKLINVIEPREVNNDIINLAIKCQEESHCYLVFYGD